MIFPLYLPSPGSQPLSHVHPGSAIVGFPAEIPDQAGQEQATVYYEGLSQASNILTLADRAMSASGRLAAFYPTSAMSIAPTTALIQIGEFDLNRGMITILPEFKETLRHWLALPTLESSEFLTTSDSAARRRDLVAALADPRFLNAVPQIKAEISKLESSAQEAIRRTLQQRHDRVSAKALR